MPRTRSFVQVDVFATSPYSGNPVAVVLNGTDLSGEEMQRLARWTNLSETTFVLPPTVAEADYRLRTFTPGGELPFAGHPTLGSARAWQDGGGTPQHAEYLVQECAAGLVTVRRGEDLLSFAAPPRVRPDCGDRRNPARRHMAPTTGSRIAAPEKCTRYGCRTPHQHADLPRKTKPTG
ncbi:PhzF family phenazine biosynthesis protein [Streptomyces sp. NPDC127190]|uniref:PhzF family phenazine biosynthesis protein n=1 Tax=unclassified Streptomyces TaxID=2593676 RepID=UPI00364419D5